MFVRPNALAGIIRSVEGPAMDVFASGEELVAERERFSRGFTKIRAQDIYYSVDTASAAGHCWPAPLNQLNPNFESSGS